MKLPVDERKDVDLVGLARRCARQVTFEYSVDDDRIAFGDEVAEFLAPGLLAGIQTGADLMRLTHAEDRDLFRNAIVETIRGAHSPDRGIHEALVRVQSAPGEWRWLAMRGNGTRWLPNGHVTQICGVLVDETERETDRREAVRMRELYAMLSAVNRALAEAADRQTLLDAVCRIAVAHGHFALAVVLLVDSGRIRLFAKAGEPAELPDRVMKETDAGRLDGRGLTSSVIRQGRAVIHRDIATVAAAHAWALPLLAAGLNAIGVFPLHENGECVGAVSLCAREAGHFDAEMNALLDGLCADVSRALDHLRIARQQAQTQALLQQASRHFKTAVHTSLDGMLVVDGRGWILEMNPAAYELLGCPPAPPREYNLFASFTPARYRATRKAEVRRLLEVDAQKTLAPGRRIETYMIRYDAGEIPVELAATALERGAEGRLMLMVRDLTVLLRQRDQLIDSARRFERLVEQSPDGVLVHIDGRIVLSNQMLRDMFLAGDAGQLLGRDLRDLMHPDYHGFHERRLDNLRQDPTLEQQMAECVMLRLDGTPIEVDVLGSATEFQGRAARQVVIRDIGDRKRIERRQASQQTVLQMIAAREPLSATLLQVARSIESHVSSARCCIYVVDESETKFVGRYTPSLPQAAFENDTNTVVSPDSPWIIGRAAGLKAPVFIVDLAADPVSPDVTAWRRSIGAESVGAWPLISLAGKLMGVIYLALTARGEPSSEVLHLVADYSDLTAVAIDNDRQAARIRHMAHHDVLTGLPNRAMFKELLDQAIARARRRCSQLAALFVDLDRFKLINDTFGHDAGDTVLRAVAERLQSAVRSGDQVARMGGDEFFVLLDDIDSVESAAQVAQRVLDALGEPIRIGGDDHQLSASIGVAVYPRDGDDSETLLKHADIAMYRSKEAGRAAYSFFADADNKHTAERFALQTQLRRALQRREFVLHYQPRVDLRSGRICGVEALVRWQHPERGLVMPGDFIPVAEETGLIVAMGLQILEIAFADVARLRAAGGEGFSVAVNLSALQLDSDGFVDQVSALVAERGVNPTWIEFELTETMLLRNPERARQVIDALRAMGFEFAIDDFGTGYSSLTYLKRFPVQCVKIDRSFVQDIPDDAGDLAITRAIVAMAASLSLRVVAEGVETTAQLEALREMGCHQYQGWYFSKARPKEAVIAMLKLEMLAT